MSSLEIVSKNFESAAKVLFQHAESMASTKNTVKS
jgi:hypothetical protein